MKTIIQYQSRTQESPSRVHIASKSSVGDYAMCYSYLSWIQNGDTATSWVLFAILA